MTPSLSLRLFGAVALLSLAACTAEQASSSDNDLSTSTPPSGAEAEGNLLKAGKLDVSGSLAANVTIETSSERLALGRAAQDGKVFLTVTLAMANREQAPLLAGWQNFSLRTRSGAVIGASEQSSLLHNACDHLSIATDASASCTVAFEVEQGEGLALVYGQGGAFVSADLPPADGCHGIAERGSDVSARVSPDVIPALPITDRAPDGLYTLVRADLFTDRERPAFNVPASTVYLRGTSFDEVSFSKVTTRVSATLEITGSEPTTSRPSCASPAPSSDLVRDTVYWAAADGELVLERPYEGGVLRRMYKRTQAF